MTTLSRAAPFPVKAVQAHWQKSTSVENLANDTHLWSIELRKFPSYINTLNSWLTSKEQSRANRIVVPYKRNHQIQSKAWLRWLLAQYLDSSVQNISYRHGPLGKPYLDSKSSGIQFNATDSGNTLLIAFHHSNELGLDIEVIPRKVSYQGIAERKLTAEEFKLLSSLPGEQQSDAFLALWTRKEGYGKAIGCGIRYPMNKVHLCDDFNNKSYLYSKNDSQDWHLLQLSGENFIACLVSSAPATNIKFYTLDIGSLEFTNE